MAYTYKPPQRLLVPCPTCGCTVLRGSCVDGKITKLAQALTPVMGEVHDCAVARKQWAPIARFLKGELVATFVTLPNGTESFMFMELCEGVQLADLAGQELTFRIENTRKTGLGEVRGPQGSASDRA